MINSVEYKTNLIASHDVKRSYMFYYILEILIGFVIIIVVYFILLHKNDKTSDDATT